MQWDRLKAEQEKEELQQCTFAPAVNGGQKGRAPLHRRLEDLQRQRRSAALALPLGSHPWPSTVTEAPEAGPQNAAVCSIDALAVSQAAFTPSRHTEAADMRTVLDASLLYVLKRYGVGAALQRTAQGGASMQRSHRRQRHLSHLLSLRSPLGLLSR